ncbi:LLM class flavin-dependent oxidoreductase [Streptomyces sp. SAS_270]|uniref:LLM class flavin-dependent oxidoreductase n=1 Tax=Streptomyces sp. SAS_270 TaxID=3412748 RepID=UPI00403CB6B2
MTGSHGRGLPHLAAALDQQGAHDSAPYEEAVRLAERGGLDFVTLGDTFAGPGPDALAVLSRLALGTRRIGLVPTVDSPHTEPFRVPAAVTALDRVSRGRAGWHIGVSTTEGEDRLSGRRHDAAARLWDSWEGGADSSMKGSSAVPRPPQGYPVRIVDATERSARPVAARYADVALVRVADPAQAAAVRAELRSAVREFGRDPDRLRVLGSLHVDLGGGERAAAPGHGGGGPRQTAQGPLYRGGPVDLAELITDWHEAGAVDGFHLTPVEPLRDLERLVNGTVALLQHRGLFRTFYPGSTLREHLGLARAANRLGLPDPVWKG